MAAFGTHVSLTSIESEAIAASSTPLTFQPIRGVMPLMTDGISVASQAERYATFEVVDDLVLPDGYTYDIIAAWGDEVGDSRFGYNNDYLSFVETSPNEGYLTVNHEYISSIPWMQTYANAIGQTLPFEAVMAAIKMSEEGIDVFGLGDQNPLKAKFQAVGKEALLDQGLSVISIRRSEGGAWERTFSNVDRRISGISGLEDERYLKTTGPAKAVFEKANKLGYDDGLGSKIVGTFGNCAGGTTPWGTVLSAEENFQDQVYEPVMADGSAFSPTQSRLVVDDEGELLGHGNTFGLAGNKYGWMVEVDPTNPDDFGTKHTWLGRYRHEAVAVRGEAGQPLAVYSGCDRRGGHLYKFVSAERVQEPTDKSNSRLLEAGTLYAAKFNSDGTGRWIPLQAETPVEPILPSQVFGDEDRPLVELPKRPEGGTFSALTDAEVAAFKNQFATLGDLYAGTTEEKQGGILIDAHYAANAAGATSTARPEDTDLGPDGSLFVAFTSGTPGSEGGPDKAVFSQAGEVWEYGWIFHIQEAGNAPDAATFTWEKMATGGEPAAGGLGFSNPDNLAFDSQGHLWMVTDMSSDKHNQAVPSGRVDEEGEAIDQSSLRGLYGNNSVWFLPTSGPNAGQAFLFAYGPMESELTGPFFTADQTTLFLAAQHPAEITGTRKDMAAETREFELKTTDGTPFLQRRTVPLGSNWPGRQPNDPPKPAVVAIRRLDAQALT